MHRIRTLQLALTALLLGGSLVTTAPAQPLVDGFTPGRGELEFALGVADQRYDDFYVGSAPAGGFRNIDEVVAQIVTLYGSYGLTDTLQLAVNIPWIHRETTGDALRREDEGLQDGSIYLNWRVQTWETRFLGPGYFSLLAAGGVTTPLSDYEPDRLTSLGHHSTDLEALVTLHQVWNSGWYASLQLGHSWRLGDPPNAFSTTVRGGWFHADFFTALWWQGMDSTRGTDIGDGPFSTNEVDSQRLGAEITYRITEAVAVSAKGSAVIDGRNVDKRRTLSLGLIYRF